ncbi:MULTISPECIES: hypothetical protein [unclassified Sphingomonas]|uniref:hypothetical protein n=1 Tax=unclassified Sphingomonas TaxID=196159 RepID=UPI000AEC35EA|nr:MULTISPECIES: hypothetical protein [unclassified Sphingomonas]
MTRRTLPLIIALAGLVSGCGGGEGQGATAADAGAAIEAAAIRQGLVPPPGVANPVGVFVRETDRVCVVPAGDRYRIGVTIDYGDGIGCTARGTVAQSGSALRIELGDCAFDARIEGEEIAFPARIPTGCAALCRGRASLSALRVQRLSDAPAEAQLLRDPRGRLLCGS